MTSLYEDPKTVNLKTAFSWSTYNQRAQIIALPVLWFDNKAAFDFASNEKRR